MTIHIAYKTLAAIDAAIQSDQGAQYRHNLGRVIPHIGDAYDSSPPEPRNHLGASILGRECGREIAYSWRWAVNKTNSGRMVRLFNRGHLEEARFIAILLTIGCQVYQQDANGKQFRINFANGHGGGSGDGIAVGVPDVQIDAPTICEFKTHGEKSFAELAGQLTDWRKHLENPKKPFTGKGVREAKFEHFVQMQLYMRKMGIPQALYLAVCKNTDDIYGEIVTLDVTIADEFFQRGETIVWSNKLPERINKSPGFWKCRFCDAREVCHMGKAMSRNCRTCQHSYPNEQGSWTCGLFNTQLSKANQMAGCQHWHQINND